MNNDLQKLIKILEKDKSDLLKLIGNSVKEKEYLFAHFHYNALEQINSQIHTLKNLDDDMFDQKNTIERMKKLLESDTSDQMKEFLNQQVLILQESLKRHEEEQLLQEQDNNQQILDNYLNLVLEKKIRMFRLVLNKNENLELEIRRIKGAIRLMIPRVAHLIEEDILFDERINKLLGLGFKLPDNKNKLILTLEGNKDELQKKLKYCLLVIVFEVFYYKDFRGQTYIVTE